MMKQRRRVQWLGIAGVLLLGLTGALMGCTNTQSIDESTVNEERMRPDSQLNEQGESKAQEIKDTEEQKQEARQDKAFVEQPGQDKNQEDESVTEADSQ